MLLSQCKLQSGKSKGYWEKNRLNKVAHMGEEQVPARLVMLHLCKIIFNPRVSVKGKVQQREGKTNGTSRVRPASGPPAPAWAVGITHVRGSAELFHSKLGVMLERDSHTKRISPFISSSCKRQKTLFRLDRIERSARRGSAGAQPCANLFCGKTDPVIPSAVEPGPLASRTASSPYLSHAVEIGGGLFLFK